MPLTNSFEQSPEKLVLDEGKHEQFMKEALLMVFISISVPHYIKMLMHVYRAKRR